MNKPTDTMTTTRFTIIGGPDKMEMFGAYGVRPIEFECDGGKGRVIIPCQVGSIIPESGGGKSWWVEGLYTPPGVSPEKGGKKIVGLYRSNGPATFDGHTSCGYIDIEK